MNPLKRRHHPALGFSKNLDNLKAAVSLQVAYYNFCWRLREKGKSGKLTPTSADQAGLTDHTWSIEELHDMVIEHEEYKKVMANAARLASRLGLV